MSNRYPDDDLDDHFETILRTVIQESHPLREQDDVSNTLLCFLVRVANTWKSIRTLRTHTLVQDGFMVDAGVLVRAMFDAYLQADYVFSDPAKRSVRAASYLDYAHVERYKTTRKVLSHDNAFSESLRASPKRSDGDKHNQVEYDRVKDQFLIEKNLADGTVKRGPRTRNKWYEGDLSRLAEHVGKQAEYDVFVAPFHGCVHSSALSVQEGPMMVSPKHVLDLATTIAARVAQINVEYNHLEIEEVNQRIIDTLCQSYLDAV